MASDLWHDLVRKLRRIEDDWKPRQPLPGAVTATHGSFMGGGILHAADSWRIPTGVLQALPGYETVSRVANVVKAIEDAEPVAFNTVAKRLGNITLDDVKPILIDILKDIALYVGGSTVVGAGIGGAIGSLAFGAGAIPGAIGGAAVGAEAGNLILTFIGLKSIAIYMKDAVPTACKYYVAGFKEAWGPKDFGGRKPFVGAATDDFAKGHVLFLTALLMGIVAYLTRGKGNMASLLAEVRGSARLGPKMAAWLEQNEGKLLNSAELRQGVRSEGVGGAEAAKPVADMPKPMRGSSSPAPGVAKEAAVTGKAADTVAKEYGVAFFGQDNVGYYTRENATIGREGRNFFLMPLDDSGIVKNAGDAARYTGMAPSAQKAYVEGGDIFGLSFPTNGMELSTPTAADAMGWPHYLEGGNTAVLTGDGPNAGYLLNPTREFVTPGGGAVPEGSVLFKLGPDGEWIPMRRF